MAGATGRAVRLRVLVVGNYGGFVCGFAGILPGSGLSAWSAGVRWTPDDPESVPIQGGHLTPGQPAGLVCHPQSRDRASAPAAEVDTLRPAAFSRA